MANRYGQAAILAAQHGANGADPVALWESALEKMYPTSPVARKRNGPREAFLGLCEEGLIKGISTGSYTNPNDNKAYAVRAVALLKAAEQHWSKSALWHEVTGGVEKQENGQIDVVLALWNNGLIVGKPAA
jgi:hypothetical protein